MLDLSGKKDGGQPGTRSYDHRQINEVYNIIGKDDLGYSEGLAQFFRRGKHKNANLWF